MCNCTMVTTAETSHTDLKLNGKPIKKLVTTQKAKLEKFI